MFKKASDIRGQQRLSGADKKKLKRNLRERFSHARDEEIDEIIPAKAEVQVTKLANKVLVYSVEGAQPFVFDCDGRGHAFCPTVYALWKVPTLIPHFLLKGWEVSRFVVSGADLMLPGVEVPAGGLPPFSEGEVWGVCIPGNPCPIAVGVTLLSQQAALKTGMRGKLLRITHHYRDTLWESAPGAFVPNNGFKEDCVMPDPEAAQQPGAGGSSPLHEDLQPGQLDQGAETATGLSSAAPAPASQEEADVGAHASAGGSGGEAEAEGRLRSLSLAEGSSAGAAEEAAAPSNAAAESETSGGQPLPMSAADVDALLDRCLLQALCTSVRPGDLPLGASALWSQHILPCRPAGVTLDIKKSTHKKLSKWLQAKVAEGLIAGKEDKHRKEFILQSINYKHEVMTAFTPEKKGATAAAQASASDAVAAAAENASSGDPASTATEVAEVWRPSSHVAPIFEAVGADVGRYYSASEARDVVFAYIEREALTKPGSPTTVTLDVLLCDALFKGAIKKGQAYPTEVHKRDVGPAFLARMQAHHSVTRGGKTVVKRGALQPVQIVTERRQGNKKVTRVTGLEAFLIDAEPLAAELQKRFAASTSVNEVPGKKGHFEILVQGGVIDDLGHLLVNSYGVPKQHIEVLDKTKR